MHGGALAIGTVFVVLGMFLFFGYFPLLGKSVEDVDKDIDRSYGAGTVYTDYKSYKPGDKLMIYGKLKEVTYNSDSKKTTFRFYAVNSDNKFFVLSDKDLTSKYKDGDEVYMNIKLFDKGVPGMPMEVWETLSPDDIQLQWLLKIFFLIPVIVGAALIGFGFRK